MFSIWLRKINSTKTLSADNSKQIMTSYFFCQDAKQKRQIITVALNRLPMENLKLLQLLQQAIQKKCLAFPMYDTQNELLQCLSLLIRRWRQSLSLVFSLPYKPTWRGISCPGLEVATCWSTSHTCQCNGYDHWGRQVAMKMGMRKREKGGGRERRRARRREGWCWRWRRNWITVEESWSALPGDWGGKERRRGWRVKKEDGGDTRERIIPRHHAGGESKVGEIKQAVFFLCCHQGIEIWERRKTSDRMSKGMTASLDLVQQILMWCSIVCVRVSTKNTFKPDPKGRKRQASPKVLHNCIKSEIQAFWNSIQWCMFTYSWVRDVLCLSTLRLERRHSLTWETHPWKSSRAATAGEGRERRDRRRSGGAPHKRGRVGGGLLAWGNQTLHATLCGQFFPKPRGGEIVRTTLYISL